MENLAGEKEVTVLIKYPTQTKKGNKVFFEKKDQELTNLDWAKWAGWSDTDGYFTTFFNSYNMKKPYWERKAGLSLKDRQPVELFSKTFETSLAHQTFKTITPKPYRKEYTATIYIAQLRGKKVRWFTENIYPYLIKQEKKDYAAKLLGYRPKSKDFITWTVDEVIHYLATAMEGDGHCRCRGKNTKCIDVEIQSSDVQYLSDLKYIANNKLGLISTLRECATYKTQEGIKTKYRLGIFCSRRNPNNLSFFQSLVKDGVMTLNRKKQKVQEFMDYIL